MPATVHCPVYNKNENKFFSELKLCLRIKIPLHKKREKTQIMALTILIKITYLAVDIKMIVVTCIIEFNLTHFLIYMKIKKIS